VIATTWLDEPIVLWSYLSARYSPLDLNSDGVTDFVFGYGVASLGLSPEGDNQFLIWPSGGLNIGGDLEPLPEGFEIGPNSGDDSWMEWFTHAGYANLITCLNGSGGYTVAGRFAGQRAYIGVEFDIDGATHYGWIDIAVATYSPGGTLYGWGYETVPGVSILAGAAVPEPSTLHLIAIGAAACLLPPRRKERE
jgi:hypothetical protein